MTPVDQPAPLQAYYLPPQLKTTMPPRAIRTVRFDSMTAEVIDEGPAYFRALTERLRMTRAAIAPHLSDHHVIDLLARAAVRWRDPRFPCRRLALSVLPALTGYAPAMIEEGLDHRLAQLSPDRLSRLIDDAADRLARRGRALQGPPVVHLVVAGHIPGLVIDELAALLMVRSAVLVRPSARDPIIPPLFAKTMSELDPRVGELVAVAWWPREAEAISAVIGDSVDAVVASGDDATIAELSRHAARQDARGMIGYGHRRSVALIGSESLTDADGLAARTARDVCWYEQRGCLSPHVVYVEEGGPMTPRTFAEHVAEALGNEADHWTPSAIPLEAGAAILQLRAELEFQESTGAQMLPIRTKRTAMGGSGGEDHLLPELSERFVRADLFGGSVLFDPDPSPRPSPGYRTLWVRPVARLERALEALTPWQGKIESVGLALSDERLTELRPQIARLAPSRLTPIGTMQEPSLRWRLLDQGLLLRLAAWTHPHSIAHF
ncbi:MAG TPA: acyl-CoA reductase [Nitrospiria bacterium]|nr:acyl-CoA reductase [Nitrospiria bacterium]